MFVLIFITGLIAITTFPIMIIGLHISNKELNIDKDSKEKKTLDFIMKGLILQYVIILLLNGWLLQYIF